MSLTDEQLAELEKALAEWGLADEPLEVAAFLPPSEGARVEFAGGGLVCETDSVEDARYLVAAANALPGLLDEVRGLRALLSGCFVPFSIREVLREKGTKEAGARWYAQSQAFLKGLQDELERLRAQLLSRPDPEDE